MRRVCRVSLRSLSARPTRIVAAAVAALAAATIAQLAPVQAADMAVPGSYYPAISPPPPAIYDWTGIYIGGHVGGGILTDSVSQSTVTTTTQNIAGSGSLRPAGVLGGAQIGANYEFVPWVVGIEASWTDSSISGSTLLSCPACQNPTSSTTVLTPQERFTSQALWFAAVTGRVGYAANDWLFYAKAGGAWMRVDYTEDLLANSGATANTQSITDNRTGFTVGLGVEFGLTENLSGKIEYNFYDFGSRNYNFFFTPMAVRSDLNTLTAGLNYRFNWSGGPKP
jgi:outer membrane immunogenic protein